MQLNLGEEIIGNPSNWIVLRKGMNLSDPKLFRPWNWWFPMIREHLHSLWHNFHIGLDLYVYIYIYIYVYIYIYDGCWLAMSPDGKRHLWCLVWPWCHINFSGTRIYFLQDPTRVYNTFIKGWIVVNTSTSTSEAISQPSTTLHPYNYP